MLDAVKLVVASVLASNWLGLRVSSLHRRYKRYWSEASCNLSAVLLVGSLPLDCCRVFRGQRG